MYMYVCIYLFIYTRTYIYTCISYSTGKSTLPDIRIYTYIYIYACVYIQNRFAYTVPYIITVNNTHLVS